MTPNQKLIEFLEKDLEEFKNTLEKMTEGEEAYYRQLGEIDCLEYLLIWARQGKII